MKKAIVTAALCVLSAAALLAAPADDPALAKVREAYAAAVNAGDAAKVAALHTQDGVEMPPNQPMVKGQAAIEAYHKQLYATAEFKLAITPTEAKASGSIAFDAGTYKQTIKLKTGQTIDDTGKYLVVFKKDAAGQWKVAHVAYNSDLAPTGPPAVFMAPADVNWVADPEGSGIKMALLWGDPKKGAYGGFLKFPAGWQAPLHHHTYENKGVVLAGTLVVTPEGGTPKEMGPNSYLVVPGGLKHTTACKAGADCVIFGEQPGADDIVFEGPPPSKK